MRKRVVFAGYFGCGNLGDDGIMAGLANRLYAEGIETVVLSGAPADTHRLYGLDAVARRDGNAVSQAIKESDALVFAGGSIFQDVTSVASVNYYAGLVTKAKKEGRKVLMVGQGVGPLKSFFGKRWAASSFNMADLIVVRDPVSATTLKQLGVNKPVRVGADCAFLLPSPTVSEDEPAGYHIGSTRTVGVAARMVPSMKRAKLMDLFAEFLKLMQGSQWMPIFVELDKEDGVFIQELDKKLGGRTMQIRKVNLVKEMQSRIGRMDAMIAMRLHAGIFATTMGVPTFFVSYDPKVHAMAKMMDMPAPPSIEDLTARRLFELATSQLRDLEAAKKRTVQKREEMAKLAEINVEAVVDALGGRKVA